MTAALAVSVLLLLGNSFLNRFQMLRDNDQLTLTKKY